MFVCLRDAVQLPTMSEVACDIAAGPVQSLPEVIGDCVVMQQTTAVVDSGKDSSSTDSCTKDCTKDSERPASTSAADADKSGEQQQHQQQAKVHHELDHGQVLVLSVSLSRQTVSLSLASLPVA